MNKHNLIKLANYLAALPDEYEHFNMRDYAFNSGLESGTIPLVDVCTLINECGSVACAIGHGPLIAGLEISPDDDCWHDYTDRVFDLNRSIFSEESHLFSFAFDSGWAAIDNRPISAAKRIALIVNNIDQVNELMLSNWNRAQVMNYQQIDQHFLRAVFTDNKFDELANTVQFPLPLPEVQHVTNSRII